MHAVWKECEQGKVVHFVVTLIEPMQMIHSSVSKPLDLGGALLEVTLDLIAFSTVSCFRFD
jgi:hypothetical protein